MWCKVNRSRGQRASTAVTTATVATSPPPPLAPPLAASTSTKPRAIAAPATTCDRPLLQLLLARHCYESSTFLRHVALQPLLQRRPDNHTEELLKLLTWAKRQRAVETASLVAPRSRSSDFARPLLTMRRALWIAPSRARSHLARSSWIFSAEGILKWPCLLVQIEEPWPQRRSETGCTTPPLLGCAPGREGAPWALSVMPVWP